MQVVVDIFNWPLGGLMLVVSRPVGDWLANEEQGASYMHMERNCSVHSLNMGMTQHALVAHL